MATKPTVSPNTGAFSLLFVLTLAVLGYTLYLIQTNQHLDVQASALTPSLLFLNPPFVKGLIVQGGFSGTLCAVLLHMFNALIYASAAFGAVYYTFHYLSEPRASAQQQPNSRKLANGENQAEINGSEVMIMLPKYKDHATGESMGGSVDKAPYAQVFYRITTRPMKLAEGVEPTVYQRLYLAIYSMLEAHKDVPASVGTHHADASLRDHSIAVSKKVVEHYRKAGKVEPLAAIAGLAHDLDKLLGYQKKGEAWVKNVNATHHNKYAAFIVSTQRAFNALPEDDRNTLVLALRYYHDPEDLPLGGTGRVDELITALRYSDGYSIKEEKTAGVQSAAALPENLEIIDKALITTISGLNINGYLANQGNAGGWTVPALEYVLIPMSTLLESVGKHLTPELTRQLQLDHETRTFNHPAADLIRERLIEMNLLMTTYKHLKTDTGMFDCRIGISRFSAILMLEKTKLDSLLPGMLEKWGKCAYGIRITSATVDKSKQSVNDVEPEEKKEA